MTDATCSFCHDASDELSTRLTFELCPDCTRGWDYTASLTPAERRADEEAMTRYCDEATAENLGGQR